MEDSDIDLYGDLDNDLDIENNDNNDFEDFMDDTELDCNKKSSNEKVNIISKPVLADITKVKDKIKHPHENNEDLDDLLNEVFTPKAPKPKVEPRKDISANDKEDEQIDEQLHFIQQRNAELESQLIELDKKNKMLQKHIANLITTSRIEIRAKNRQILDLTREIENVMFRRAGKVLTKREIERLFQRIRPPCNFNCLGAAEIAKEIESGQESPENNNKENENTTTEKPTIKRRSSSRLNIKQEDLIDENDRPKSRSANSRTKIRKEPSRLDMLADQINTDKYINESKSKSKSKPRKEVDSAKESEIGASKDADNIKAKDFKEPSPAVVEPQVETRSRRKSERSNNGKKQTSERSDDKEKVVDKKSSKSTEISNKDDKIAKIEKESSSKRNRTRSLSNNINKEPETSKELKITRQIETRRSSPRKSIKDRLGRKVDSNDDNKNVTNSAVKNLSTSDESKSKTVDNNIIGVKKISVDKPQLRSSPKKQSISTNDNKKIDDKKQSINITENPPKAVAKNPPTSEMKNTLKLKAAKDDIEEGEVTDSDDDETPAPGEQKIVETEPLKSVSDNSNKMTKVAANVETIKEAKQSTITLANSKSNIENNSSNDVNIKDKQSKNDKTATNSGTSIEGKVATEVKKSENKPASSIPWFKKVDFSSLKVLPEFCDLSKVYGSPGKTRHISAPNVSDNKLYFARRSRPLKFDDNEVLTFISPTKDVRRRTRSAPPTVTRAILSEALSNQHKNQFEEGEIDTSISDKSNVTKKNETVLPRDKLEQEMHELFSDAEKKNEDQEISKYDELKALVIEGKKSVVQDKNKGNKKEKWLTKTSNTLKETATNTAMLKDTTSITNNTEKNIEVNTKMVDRDENNTEVNQSNDKNTEAIKHPVKENSENLHETVNMKKSAEVLENINATNTTAENTPIVNESKNDEKDHLVNESNEVDENITVDNITTNSQKTEGKISPVINENIKATEKDASRAKEKKDNIKTVNKTIHKNLQVENDKIREIEKDTSNVNENMEDVNKTEIANIPESKTFEKITEIYLETSKEVKEEIKFEDIKNEVIDNEDSLDAEELDGDDSEYEPSVEVMLSEGEDEIDVEYTPRTRSRKSLRRSKISYAEVPGQNIPFEGSHESYQTARWKCDLCKLGFFSKSQYLIHRKKKGCFQKIKSLTEDKLEDNEVLKLLEKVPLTSTGTKEHYKVVKWNCDLCQLGFPKRQDMRDHREKFNCGAEEKRIRSKETEEQRLIRAQGTKELFEISCWECRECEVGFLSRFSRDFHRSITHNSGIMLEQIKNQQNKKTPRTDKTSKETKVDENKEPIKETTEPTVEETVEPTVEETAEPQVDESAEPKVDESKESIKVYSSSSSSSGDSDSSDSSTDDDSDASPQLSKSWFMPQTTAKPQFQTTSISSTQTCTSTSPSLTISSVETTDTDQTQAKVETATNNEATVEKSPKETTEDNIAENDSEQNVPKATSPKVIETPTHEVDSPTEATNVVEKVVDENKEERGSSPDIGPEFLKKPKLRGPVGNEELDLAISSITGETDETDLELFLHDDEFDFEPEENHEKKVVNEKIEKSIKSSKITSPKKRIKSSNVASPIKCHNKNSSVKTDVETTAKASDKPTIDSLSENLSTGKFPMKSVPSPAEVKEAEKDFITDKLETDVNKVDDTSEVSEAIANIADYISDPINKEKDTTHALTNEDVVINKNVNETTPSKVKPMYSSNETQVFEEGEVREDSPTTMPKPKVLDFTSQEDELQLHFDEDLLDFNLETSPMKATISKPSKDNISVKNKIVTKEAISSKSANKDEIKDSSKTPNIKATIPSCDALSPQNMEKYTIPKKPKGDLKEKDSKEVERKHAKEDRKDKRDLKTTSSSDERRRDVERDPGKRKDRNDKSSEKDRRRDRDGEIRRDRDEKSREKNGDRRRDREESSREKDDYIRRNERDEKSREKDNEKDKSKTKNDLKMRTREKEDDRDRTKSRKRQRSISPERSSNARRERRRSHRSRSRSPRTRSRNRHARRSRSRSRDRTRRTSRKRSNSPHRKRLRMARRSQSLSPKRLEKSSKKDKSPRRKNADKNLLENESLESLEAQKQFLLSQLQLSPQPSKQATVNGIEVVKSNPNVDNEPKMDPNRVRCESGSDKENSKSCDIDMSESTMVAEESPKMMDDHSNESDKLKFDSDVLKDYSEDEIYNQILPFKQKQLEQLKEVEDTLKAKIRIKEQRLKEDGGSRRRNFDSTSSSSDQDASISKPRVAPLKLSLRNTTDNLQNCNTNVTLLHVAQEKCPSPLTSDKKVPPLKLPLKRAYSSSEDSERKVSPLKLSLWDADKKKKLAKNHAKDEPSTDSHKADLFKEARAQPIPENKVANDTSIPAVPVDVIKYDPVKSTLNAKTTAEISYKLSESSTMKASNNMSPKPTSSKISHSPSFSSMSTKQTSSNVSPSILSQTPKPSSSKMPIISPTTKVSPVIKQSLPVTKNTMTFKDNVTESVNVAKARAAFANSFPIPNQVNAHLPKKTTPPFSKSGQSNITPPDSKSVDILDDLALSESDADSPMKPCRTPIKRIEQKPQKLFVTPQKSISFPLPISPLPRPLSPLEDTMSPPKNKFPEAKPISISHKPFTNLKVQDLPKGSTSSNVNKNAVIDFKSLSSFKGSAIVKKRKKRISLRPSKGPMEIIVGRRSSNSSEGNDSGNERTANPIPASVVNLSTQLSSPSTAKSESMQILNTQPATVPIKKDAIKNILDNKTDDVIKPVDLETKAVAPSMPLILAPVDSKPTTIESCVSNIDVTNEHKATQGKIETICTQPLENKGATIGENSEAAKASPDGGAKSKKKRRNKLGFGLASASPVICVQSQSNE